jgi:hypothetical protein
MTSSAVLKLPYVDFAHGFQTKKPTATGVSEQNAPLSAGPEGGWVMIPGSPAHMSTIVIESLSVQSDQS